jgi:hypothetical protein
VWRLCSTLSRVIATSLCANQLYLPSQHAIQVRAGRCLGDFDLAALLQEAAGRLGCRVLALGISVRAENHGLDRCRQDQTLDPASRERGPIGRG